MKFYSVMLYNKQGQYCGCDAYALADSERIEDACRPEDRFSPITCEDFYANPVFYRQYTEAAKAERNK
jgi:hypothetical protein